MNKINIINSIFFPRRYHLKKDEKDYMLEVEPGVKIGARLFLKDKSYDNIIFFHGNGEIAQEYDSIADIYAKFDCNLIVVDYRGYGLSEGTPNKENLLLDAVKSFDSILRLIRKEGYNGKVLVMGRSLGSASACQIISKRSKHIDGCIIESGFVTEYDLFELMGLNPERVGFTLADGFNNLEKIKQHNRPLLIIHAKEDHIVPLSQGELAYESAQSKNKNIFIVEGANHNDIMYRAKDDYFVKIRTFIDSI